jgi:uncharacterized membrane protein
MDLGHAGSREIMNAFSIALGAFALLHLGVSATGLRAKIITAIGEGPYRGLFSLASAGLLIWMILALGALRADPGDALNAALWIPPPWARHVTHSLVLLGFLLAVAGILTPGPTLAGFEGSVSQEEPARGVLRITRHPFLWGLTLWALGHLAVNGERWAVMLFGVLGLMALYGTRSIDRKGRARNLEAWAKFEAATSNVPFAAIVQGRNRLVLGEMWWRLLAALIVFALVGLLHERIIGAAAFAFQL